MCVYACVRLSLSLSLSLRSVCVCVCVRARVSLCVSLCVCVVCVCVKVSEEVLQEIKRAVLQKTVDGMREEGTPYVGEMTQNTH